MELRVSGLEPGTYELWLTRDGALEAPCGAFVVAEGETTVPLNAPYVLKDFEKEVWNLPQYQGTSLDFLGLVNITEPTKDGWGPLLLVVYVASQLTSSYFMAATMQKAQRIMLMVLPIVFIPFILNFPTGLMIYWLTTNLWTTGQGIVTRRQIPRPVAPPKRSSRTPPKDEPRASGNGEAPSGAPPPASPGSGTPRRVKRKRGGRTRK